MITLEEARKLSGIDQKQEYLNFIEHKIRYEAIAGNTSVLIREEPYASWLYSNSQSKPQVVKEVLEELTSLGFKLKLYYCEGQFVDIGLNISWSL